MGETMKSLREQFEDDYAAVRIPTDNKDGFKIRYVYYAPWYLWDLPGPMLKRKKRLLSGVSICGMLVFLLTGIQKSALNSYVIVEMAGTLALCAHVFELFSIAQFLFAKYRTSRMTYVNISRILNCVPLIRALCLMVAVISCIYYMLHNTFHLNTAIVAAGYLVCTLMALYVFKEYRKMPLRTEKNVKGL
jgi:hypothetical protein